MAPTRLALAGATAGQLSGTVAALVYSLHCPELQAPFVRSWYPLGMLIPAAVGAGVAAGAAAVMAPDLKIQKWSASGGSSAIEVISRLS